MASFINFTWKVQEDRRQGEVIKMKTKDEGVVALIVAEEQPLEQEEALHRQEYNSAPGVDKSLPPTPHTAAPPTAAQEPLLQRLGWRQRFKEFFRPNVRKKRVLGEFTISQRIPTHVDEPVEPLSLPAAGLEKLRRSDQKPLPASPIEDSFNTGITQGDDDLDITALPRLPSCCYQAPAGLSVPRDQDNNPFIKDLAEEVDKAMDEAVTVPDAPGNRSSTRLLVTSIWTREKLESPCATEIDGTEQQVLVAQADFLPLPSAIFLPGSTPLPNLSVPGSRPATARSKVIEDIDGAQKMSASGKWFGGGNAD